METKDWLFLIGGIILLIASIGAVIFSLKSGKRINKALSGGLPEVKEFKARVKALLHENEGGYFVVFENEEGEDLKLEVSDETFMEFAEGEAGLLSISGGELLSFVIDD